MIVITTALVISIIIASLALQVAQADNDKHATDDSCDNSGSDVSIIIASLVLQVAQAADDCDNNGSGDKYHHSIPGIGSCASRRR